mgnify:FL=1
MQVKLAEIRKEYAALNPEDIKLIDPCMGSGHILVYAFDVLMQIYGSEVSVHTGEGPERAVLTAKWDDDETIQSIIRELNFGRYAPDRERMVRHD